MASPNHAGIVPPSNSHMIAPYKDPAYSRIPLEEFKALTGVDGSAAVLTTKYVAFPRDTAGMGKYLEFLDADKIVQEDFAKAEANEMSARDLARLGHRKYSRTPRSARRACSQMIPLLQPPPPASSGEWRRGQGWMTTATAIRPAAVLTVPSSAPSRYLYAEGMVRPAVYTAVFFVLAPGTTAGLVPWLITGWARPGHGLGPLDAAGWCSSRSASPWWSRASRGSSLRASGTPAPVAPTETLVVGGLYRYVRNPMYVGVASVITGQALLFRSWGVAAWLAVFLAAVVSFVKGYEEPPARTAVRQVLRALPPSGAGMVAPADGLPALTVFDAEWGARQTAPPRSTGLRHRLPTLLGDEANAGSRK